MKVKITKEQVGNALKTIGFLGSCLVTGFLCMARDNTTKPTTYYIGEANYSDAVSVIMRSSMFDSTKSSMIDILKRDADPEYYKSVITTVNSKAFDTTKLHIVETMTRE